MNDIELVRPCKLATSDKYSANLYRYIMKWRDQGIDALASDRDWITGEVDGFNFADPKPFRIVIGRRDYDGCIYGARLSTILNRKKSERFAFMPKDAEHYRDVSDWFWSEYARIGRALWDMPGRTAMIGDEARWEALDKTTRRCTWSGRIYTSHVETTHRAPIVRTVWTLAALCA